MRTAATDAALENSLSTERLEKYLVATGGNLHNCLTLYERNARLAESFYTPLQCMEVCFRNSLDQQMIGGYGVGWFQNGAPPFDRDALESIEKAVKSLSYNRKPITPGAIVAELSFGFWVGLLGPRYDNTLWRQALFKAFRENGAGMQRKRVHGRFNALRRFRNRIAHHEPIFLNDLPARHTEIIEATSWMCADTAAWTLYCSRFQAVYAAP